MTRSDITKTIVFVVIEDDLSQRFNHLRLLPEINYVTLNLRAKNSVTIWETILHRIMSRRSTLRRIEEIAAKYAAEKYLILSNSEGYLAKNFIRIIRQNSSTILLGALQHGMLPFRYPKTKRMTHKAINWVTRKCFSLDAAGVGFLNREIDFYVTSSQLDRDNLVAQGILKSRIAVSSYITKGLFERVPPKQIPNSDRAKVRNSALFLLQPLSSLRLCSKKTEVELNDRILRWLTEYFSTVYVKQHPYEDVEITQTKANVVVIPSVKPVINELDFAISFFSEGLRELQWHNVSVGAVYDPRIKVAKSIYKYFPIVYRFSSACPEVILVHRENGAYENEISNISELLRLFDVGYN